MSADLERDLRDEIARLNRELDAHRRAMARAITEAFLLGTEAAKGGHRLEVTP